MSWFWNKHDNLELARFVIHAKDSEAVKTFIDQAIQSSHLPQSDYDFHQTQNDGRKQLIEKIYNALRQHEIEYALNEYHELSGDRQLIRTPEEILDTQRRGTCLDLTILFSAICWHYDLLPILTLVEGHALVAVSLTHSLRDWENQERRGQQLFWEGQGKLTDSNKLQKMVKREDYLAIECTGFAKSETLSECEDEKFQRVDGVLSFDQAVQLGRQQLTRSLKFALDIHIAYNFWWSKVVCPNRLEAEPIKQLINSPLTNGENPLLKLYVPLGLIERKPDAQRRPFENASPPEASPFNQPDDQYEVVQKYDGEAFLEQVLKHKHSMSQGKRLAIVGDPGGGKTTLLQRIAYWVLEEEQGLPILVPLGDVNENWVKGRDETDEGWLYRYLSENWLRNVAGEPEKTPIELQHLFAERLKSGQVWLLLDGANEMALKSPLMRIKEQLAKGWADSVKVVLNCRLNLWEVEKEALWETFDIYRTLDFSYPEQVHQFINNWFGEDNPEANRLQAKLAEENRKRIQDLVKNPLRLALLCRIWKEGLGTLPDTKADFYRLLVENHYKWKDDSTNEEFEIPEDRKKELNQALGQLARDAIDSKDFRFRLRESSIRKYLKYPNVKDSLFWWALKLGWLLDVGFPTEGETNRGEKVYAFFHPTFQEYFASTVDDNYDFFLPNEHRDRPVKDKNNPEKYERYRIFERQWKEVILLWLGRPEREVSDKQKEEFINALVKFEDGCEKFYWYQAYFIAAAGMAELNNFSDLSTRNHIVDNIIKWSFGYTYYLNKSLKCVEDAAKLILSETNLNLVITKLSNLLDEEGRSEKTIFEVASFLLRLYPGHSKSLAAMKHIIQNSQNTEIRKWASLKFLESNPDESDPMFDCAYKILLEPIGGAITRETWERNWEHWTNWHSNRPNCGNDALSRLLSIAREAYNNQNQAENQTKKFIVSDMSLKGTTIQEQVQELIENLENGINPEVHLMYIHHLTYIGHGNKKAIQQLIKIVRAYKNPDFYYAAIEGLGLIGIGSREAFDCLLELINHGRVQGIVIWSMKNILDGDLFYLAVRQLKHQVLLCYDIIWHCAQNMPYPDFYEAWHPQEEVGNTTTLNSQSLNQADLQESLQSAIANEPQLNQTIHLICIDTRKFIDPNNPAAKIYVEMIKQGCSKSDDGTPKTMQDLQVYWDLLTIESDSTIVLVFYTSSDNPTPGKGTAMPYPYSDTFLTDLSKFEGGICIITDQPFDHIPLEYFTPSQPIADVVEWIRAIATKQSIKS